MVKYCKTCQENNNYICSICLPEDYEVNPITGSCVKKTEKVPDITWKDILRLEMNQQKTINGKTIYGPSLILRGLTNSQINTGHAFLVYLVFQLKNADNNIRNLEEEKKIPAICEIVDSVDETNDDLNIVEYNCIGNMTLKEEQNLNLNDYNLKNIEQNENDNNGVLGKNNLDEIVSNTELSNLQNKEKSNFTLGNLIETTTFKMDEIKNQTSDNYIFDFTINGEINKELEENIIKGKIEIAEIKNESADCKLNINKNKKADLNCVINVEKYKEYKILSFKTSEIGSDNNKIYLLNMNKINLINKEKIDENNDDSKNKENKINENNNNGDNGKNIIKDNKNNVDGNNNNDNGNNVNGGSNQKMGKITLFLYFTILLICTF